MIFMLGAFSAGLLALLLLPAFWARASRLSRRRLEMLMPLSMDEVTAERDLLRAEFAAEKRRLEQRMEGQAAEHAAELAELGRRASAIVGLEKSLATLREDHADLQARHDATVRELAQANGECSALATEVYDATGLHERIRARHDALAKDHEDLEALAEERRVAIVSLETKQTGLEARIEGLTRELEAQTRAARNETDRATGLLEERDMLRKELRTAEQMTQAAQARFELERGHVAQMQQSIDQLRIDVDAAQRAQREAERARDAADGARQEAEDDARKAARRAAAQLDAARAAESSSADRIEALKSEIGRLTGALAAAREARPANGGGAAADTAMLRDAIAEIGAKVAQMSPEPPGGG